jgi:phosphate:Na+ symporter
MITALLGGFGLFLLGMIILTDGLRSAAGGALRVLLVRFTAGPLRALITGATVTALLQSSTATVVLTIGFVSAGLIGFRSAIAVVFGANVGTTSTGWIVALLGLKLSIGAVALPAIAFGALVRLLTRGRLAGAGLALAGFGLIFAGIDMLQIGMADLALRIDPASLPAGSILDRLLLVGVGTVMTVVMQSSSAAVATTLTALHSGAIGTEQAAALVVGQNIGTTVTAALAAVGASVAARRTAAAHILFNVLTGAIAFALVPLVLRAEVALWPGDGAPDPAMLVAAFHTTFNLIGIGVLAPFGAAFARLVIRLVPDDGPDFTRHLDPSVARVPEVAAEVARRTVMQVAAALFGALDDGLRRPGRAPAALLDRADHALADTRRFIARAQSHESGADPAHHLSVLHAIDHLDRLIERLRIPPHRDAVSPDFIAAATLLATALETASTWLAGAPGADPAQTCRAVSGEVADRRRRQREDALRGAAAGHVDPDRALVRMEAMRWLDAVAYHVWRSLHHLVSREADSQVELHD